jgi:hypothetical protein
VKLDKSSASVKTQKSIDSVMNHELGRKSSEATNQNFQGLQKLIRFYTKIRKHDFLKHEIVCRRLNVFGEGKTQGFLPPPGIDLSFIRLSASLANNNNDY